jgi:hypothetical protein
VLEDGVSVNVDHANRDWHLRFDGLALDATGDLLVNR